MITQSELGGAQIYVLDLAYYLKNKYKVIICYGEQGNNGELANVAKNMGIERYAIDNLVREVNLKKDWKAFLDMIKLIKAIKPDILHLNSTKISILGSLAGRFCKVKKIIYTAHGWVFNEKLSNKKKNFYIKLERFTAKFKHKIICVSNFDYKTALKYKICAKNKLTVIHNGIKQPKFLGRVEARKIILNKINHDYNIDYDHSKTIFIGSIGNLYKNKGFGLLVNATKILVDNGINVTTVIIGEGNERNEIENWINQLKMQNHVFLLGNIENAKKLLKAFDFYVCSSTKEGLSYTIIEAMTAGLPVVATSAGGNPELISHLKTGFIVPTENSDKIASAITTLYKSKELALQFAKKARQRALKKFTIAKMISETENLYEKM